MSDTIKTAYVFPGQGSQWGGMGRDLYNEFKSARDVFDLADESLGFAISELCFNGPEEDLKQTINSQPAIVTVSLACLAAAQENGGLPEAIYTAGHSLGEYTALAAAGVLDTAAVIRLARERGRLMEQASKQNPGGMAAIIGLSQGKVSQITLSSGSYIANINSPEQIVISGPTESIAEAVSLAEKEGARRAITLQVSGAFHTPLMKPAANGMAAILDETELKNPVIPIIANTTARPLTLAADIKKELIDQFTGGVLWQASVEHMAANGINTFIEIGPGRVLAGLIRKIDRNIQTINIGDAGAITRLSSIEP